MTQSHIKNQKTTALLAAFCIFLSTIEYMVPKPLPFMRLGLANLPILLSLAILPPRTVLVITLFKVLGQGLINGTLFSYIFIFSLSGSFASTLVMLGARKLFKSHISVVGISVLGALASNIIQIGLAYIILFGNTALLIGPPLLIIGLVSSIILGLFALKFSARSRWFKEQLS